MRCINRQRPHKSILPACSLAPFAAAVILVASGLLCGTRNVAQPAPTTFSRAAAQMPEALVIAGRVLLPDGRPAAGAHVQVDLYQFDSKRRGFPSDLLKQWTSLASIVTDSEGRFRQSIERDWKAEKRSRIEVTALAPGYGFATPDSFAPARNRSLELKLVADEPVRGRVLDLQGRPVAGARLDIRRICCSTPRLVDRWLAALPPNPVFGGYGFVNNDEAPLMYGIGSTPHFPGGISTPSNAVVPVATTDAEGRFEIHGLGRDRLIFFRLTGPSLATSEVRVLTRSGKVLRFEHVINPGQEFIYAPTFDYAAGPGITLEGTVTDEDSAAPLGGVAIECQATEGLWGGNQGFLSTTTDERGHYRIEGVNPIAKSTLKVEPEGPYLEMHYISLPTPHGLDPIHRDLKLRRGLWATGRAFNLKTGQPVQGTLYYTPFRSNDSAKRYARYTTNSMGLVSRVPFGQTDAEGRFRIPVIPGRGVICLKTWDGHFRPAFGVALIKELAHEKAVSRSIADEPMYDSVSATGFSALREINAPAGTTQVEIDLPVDPGQDVTLKFVDRAGNRLSGVDAYGIDPQSYRQHTDTDTAAVAATGTDETRVVWFKHTATGLTKSMRFTPRPGETERTITLEPPAVIVGRLVEPQQQPLRIMRLDWWLPASPINLNPPILTDADGRFRIEVPGGEPVRLVVGASAHSWPAIREKLEVHSGEQIDLGTIVMNFDPKARYADFKFDRERRTTADKK
jgi:protocatechuate 3,4-dioxygenase beta subunit